jgi:membrane associated rhomboid family serine protease
MSTWGLIVVNVGIFLLEIGATGDAVKALLASFAATPAAITHQAPGGSLPPEFTLVIGGWVLLQLYQIANQASDGVAYVAHGGGLVAGALLFLVMRPADVHLFDCASSRAKK